VRETVVSGTVTVTVLARAVATFKVQLPGLEDSQKLLEDIDSLTMDANPRDHLRQAIDSQINSVKESIRESLRALNQRRNELAPISSLPTEIITDIILLASAKRDGFGLEWLNVAHVCRQWRDIALNKRLFWSHIDFTNLTLAGLAEILARAKEAPLHLEAKVVSHSWDEARYSAFGKELQAHVSHIRHLDIGRIGGPVLWTALQHTLFASPAPILEHLSLSYPFPGWMLFLPKDIFEGTTPRLSFLQLFGINISWKSPLLRGLRYLQIYELNKENKLRVADWLDALEEMPQLKQLVLHASSLLPDGFMFPSDIKRSATLPALTHLDLVSTARACATALAHLDLPALTSLIVQARSSNCRGHDALSLFRYVAQHAHGPQDAQPLQSMFLHSDAAYTRIATWCIDMSDAPDLEYYQSLPPNLLSGWPRRTARVMLSITCEQSDSWYTSAYVRVLDAAIEALPLDSLVTLTAEGSARLDEQVWLRHAPRWPLLEHVKVAPRAARGLREMLLLEDNDGHKSPLLPSLTKLDLLGETSLTKRRTLRLCDALKKRVEQGVPLQALTLHTTCKWSTGAVQLLRTLVADVRVYMGQFLGQLEGSPAVDPETCQFVEGHDNSDEEKEGWDDDEVEEDDDGEEEEEDEG
jgi:hypothetical protein